MILKSDKVTASLKSKRHLNQFPLFEPVSVNTESQSSTEMSLLTLPLEKVGYTPTDNTILAQNLPDPIQVVQTEESEQKVYELWVDIYKDVYPAFSPDFSQ